MKEDKKEKTHSVVTPNPPQDMDPSTHPAPKNNDKNAKAKNKAKASKDSIDFEEKKLAPREEL